MSTTCESVCDTQAVTSITTDSRNTAWSWLVEACSQKTYDRAREIWAHYVMQNYHDHSVLSGILLLADVFQNFRNSFYEQHQLDQLQFITLPFWHRPHHRSEHVRNDREQYAGRDCDHLSPTCPGPLMEGDDPSKPNSWITYLDAITSMEGDVETDARRKFPTLIWWKLPPSATAISIIPKTTQFTQWLPPGAGASHRLARHAHQFVVTILKPEIENPLRSLSTPNTSAIIEIFNFASNETPKRHICGS